MKAPNSFESDLEPTLYRCIECQWDDEADWDTRVCGDCGSDHITLIHDSRLPLGYDDDAEHYNAHTRNYEYPAEKP